MQLSTIDMPKTEARRAFLEYRKAVRERHSDEDAQIMRGYRALARGQQLIDLPKTLRAGGSEVKTFRLRNGENVFRVPRLAAIRADAKVCFTEGIQSTGSLTLTADRRVRDMAASNRKDRLDLPAETFEPGNGHTWGWGPYVKAIVPNVPPPLRPAHKLSGYTILWEAEWAPDPEPPVDPALLKHVGGDLYAVVAIWNLTELERAVLAARG